jgi:xanthine dehydrogenase accessory factor
VKSDLLDRLLEARVAGHPVALVTDLADHRQCLVFEDTVAGRAMLDKDELPVVREALTQDRSGVIDRPDRQLFVHAFNPPERAIIVGAVHVAQVLAPMAALAGYAVTIVDPRRAFATDARFPDVTLIDEWPDEAFERLAPDARTAIITLTHDPKIDDPALAAALASPAFYIGALGSTRTHAGRLERLAARGFGAADLARIHGPIGLSIGAKTPAEIAISIMAELTAVRRGKSMMAKSTREAAA